MPFVSNIVRITRNFGFFRADLIVDSYLKSRTISILVVNVSVDTTLKSIVHFIEDLQLQSDIKGRIIKYSVDSNTSYR